MNVDEDIVDCVYDSEVLSDGDIEEERVGEEVDEGDEVRNFLGQGRYKNFVILL